MLNLTRATSAFREKSGHPTIAENPQLWPWVERRWEELTAGFTGAYGTADPQARAAAGIDDDYLRELARRRLEALAVARTMNTSEVDASEVEAFEPEERQHVN